MSVIKSVEVILFPLLFGFSLDFDPSVHETTMSNLILSYQTRGNRHIE